MNNINIKKITICSLLIGIFVLLSFMSINLYNIKITFQNLTILVSCVIFGMSYGMIVGGIGMLLHQMLTYGFTQTTILWILPYVVAAIVFNNLCKKNDIYNICIENNTTMINKKIFFSIIISLFTISILNTFALFIDSKIFGYYSFALVFGSFIFKIINVIIMSFIYTIVLPIIVKNVHKLS